MTFFPPWNKYFLFRKNVTVWCFLRKISSSQISVLFEIALQSVTVLEKNPQQTTCRHEFREAVLYFLSNLFA